MKYTIFINFCFVVVLKYLSVFKHSQTEDTMACLTLSGDSPFVLGLMAPFFFLQLIWCISSLLLSETKVGRLGLLRPLDGFGITTGPTLSSFLNLVHLCGFKWLLTCQLLKTRSVWLKNMPFKFLRRLSASRLKYASLLHLSCCKLIGMEVCGVVTRPCPWTNPSFSHSDLCWTFSLFTSTLTGMSVSTLTPAGLTTLWLHAHTQVQAVPEMLLRLGVSLQQCQLDPILHDFSYQRWCY